MGLFAGVKDMTALDLMGRLTPHHDDAGFCVGRVLFNWQGYGHIIPIPDSVGFCLERKLREIKISNELNLWLMNSSSYWFIFGQLLFLESTENW